MNKNKGPGCGVVLYFLKNCGVIRCGEEIIRFIRNKDGGISGVVTDRKWYCPICKYKYSKRSRGLK